MQSENIFKSYIMKINTGFKCAKEKQYGQMIFKLINIDNIHFFAEEISTGCIFPIYYVSPFEGRVFYQNISYVYSAKWFVLLPIKAYTKENFRYKVNSDDLEYPSADEINKYLMSKSKTGYWKSLMENMEKENHYMCSIKLIKEKIMMLKKENNIFDLEMEEMDSKRYIEAVNISEISELGYNLSLQSNLCKLIGRESEIKRIIKDISIRNKSVVLVGPSGAGKTAIVESLALAIRNGQNKWLEGKLIFSLNTSMLEQDTKYRGEFGEKINKLISFLKKYNNNIILFVDEIHTLHKLGSSEDSSLDAMNILKPYISSGQITIIGATTNEEYTKYMSKDPAFISRFEKIDIYLPDRKLNIEILLSYIKNLESKYQVKLELDDNQKYFLLGYIVDITELKNQRVVGDIKMTNPRLSKDIIENAFVEAVYSERTFVTVEDICFAIIDCDKLSFTFRKERAEELKRKIMSQKEVRESHRNLSLIKIEK